MKTALDTKQQLQLLARKWRRLQKKFDRYAQQHRKSARLLDLDTDLLMEANRYEGESIGCRWCAEDLEKLISKLP